MLRWIFRLRVRLHESGTLRFEALEHVLEPNAEFGPITMSSWPKGSPIDKSEWLLFRGAGESEEQAWTRGRRFEAALRRTFARLGISALMGKPQSWTLHGRELQEQHVGPPLLDDTHGLMVFPSDPPPAFFGVGGAKLSLGHATWRFEQTLRAASSDAELPDERERMAFDLFGASRFENSAGARLITLTMAIETLLIPRPRSAEGLAHVEKLIALTDADDSLEAHERQSLRGSLEWLRSQSITRTGAQFIRERLGGRLYAGGFHAEDVWTRCYRLRGNLAHGHGAPRAEVERFEGLLFQVVGDLLSGPLLSFEPAAESSTT